MLCKNIEINNLQETVIPFNVGLGDKETSGRIDKNPVSNLGGMSIQENESNAPRFNNLEIKRLDDMADKIKGKIDFVKIDTEGFELKTLAGARKTLEKHRPIVFIETFDDNIKSVKEFFADMDYDKPIPFDFGNFLFIPKGK
jgi:FkbM family methyltransferase